MVDGTSGIGSSGSLRLMRQIMAAGQPTSNRANSQNGNTTLMDQLFNIIDTNSDGAISKDELTSAGSTIDKQQQAAVSNLQSQATSSFLGLLQALEKSTAANQTTGTGNSNNSAQSQNSSASSYQELGTTGSNVLTNGLTTVKNTVSLAGSLTQQVFDRYIQSAQTNRHIHSFGRARATG